AVRGRRRIQSRQSVDTGAIGTPPTRGAGRTLTEPRRAGGRCLWNRNEDSMKRFSVCVVALLAASPAIAAPQMFKSSAGDIAVDTVVGGLVHPWSLAFLPDNRMLVTERPGRMRIATPDGRLSPPIANVPKVVAGGQAGLLDVALDRTYSANSLIYF